MGHELVWATSPKSTLVLEPGEVASSYYLPPLLGFNNEEEYGKGNFIKALMVSNSDNPQLAVFIRSREQAKSKYFAHPNYVYDIDMFEDTMELTRIIYDIPLNYRNDYFIFAAGMYSAMSEDAKLLIHEHSGSRYRVAKRDGAFIYDKKLLVLERSIILRAYLEKMLDTKIDELAELLDRPGVDNYWVE